MFAKKVESKAFILLKDKKVARKAQTLDHRQHDLQLPTELSQTNLCVVITTL